MSERNHPKSLVVHLTSSITKYSKRGFIDEAKALFQLMPQRNVVSYNAMLSGFLQNGRLSEARRLFEEMPERNVVSWTAMICGLADAGRVCEARKLFEEMPERNVVSWNSMVVGLIRNGELNEARKVFNSMPIKNVISWNAMIAGYVECCMMGEAIVLFEEMEERNVVTWTSMISGYCRAGEVEEGYCLFRRMPRKNVVSWTAMIGGFAWNGFHKESLLLFIEMKGICDNGNNCNVQSCNSMINGYIRFGRLEEAQNLFDTVPVRDEISWTSMIDGYLSVGQVSNAYYLFHNMPDRDAVAWTAMISGLVQNELFVEATYLFMEMRAHGVPPLNATFSVLFGAAGATANIDLGRQIHCVLMKTESESDLILENCLISMYAKCGVIDNAYNIFSNMVSRDLVSWNSMVMGFSHHGLANETLKVFESMLESGTHPNSVTFLGILSACSHAGLVSRGWELFNAMFDVYKIQPGPEHYVSMINLLGRAGKIKEAEEFVLRLPFEPDHRIWGALLGACGFCEGNAEIAEHAAKRLLELDPLNAPAHVVLCNIYAASGRHVEEHKLRMDMGLKGVRKVPGCSWLMRNGGIQMFLSGDKIPAQVAEILL
ncbi:hypothetical protein CISIN_1g007519mg [Citrus sinensis]|uniref:Pentacotripeptide-repeat region of PRORP domain-containing protein n=1 Tax=Citrus sinensis TaxID=2711 RepID=A0A067DKN1_CITSI|nr:hypothetical protein CISIN_1g007519mg [Citrus sinensis]